MQNGVSTPGWLDPRTCHHEGEVKALLHRLAMHLVGQCGKAHILLVILQRAEGTWDRDTISTPPTLGSLPFPQPTKGFPGLELQGMRPCPPKAFVFTRWGHSPSRSPSPQVCVPPSVPPQGHILHLGGVVGVQLSPGAARAVGAGGRGGGDVLLEIRGPGAGEKPGVPLVTAFVWGDPGPAAQGVAGLPPALRGLHLPGAVSCWAIPQELGQLSLVRVLLQETLYLGTKGAGESRWQCQPNVASPSSASQSPKPQQPDTCSLKVAGMGGETGHGHPRGQATTLGTATGTAMGTAVGTAVVPCTSGAYDLRRGDGSQLLALRGTGVGTFPLGTPLLLGVFWGSQEPPAPHGLPGGQGGGREEAETPRRYEERLGGGLSGAAAAGRQRAGRGPLVPTAPPAARSRGVGTGTPVPAVPGERQGRGHGDMTSTPTPPCPGCSRGAECGQRAGAGGGDRHSCPRAAARGPAGLG